MFRAQVFRLYPTAEQEAYFRRAVGAARFAWNWALSLRERYYRRFGKAVSGFTLMKKWNRHKQGKFAWAAEVSKIATAVAVLRIDKAFKAFIANLARRPRFKKKGRCRDSFCAADAGAHVDFRGQLVRLPIVGEVRFRGDLRWPTATIKQATVYREADRWFVSVLFELPDSKPKKHKGPTAGIDLGCITFATVASKGVTAEEIAPPKPYAKAKRRLRRLSRAVCRKVKGSKNREKAKRLLARQHAKVKMVRADFLHKLTRRLVRTYRRIGLEDLCVKGMQRGFLSRSISDLGFGEFRRQMTYKAEETGAELVFADRFYPSSKTCSRCGHVRKELSLEVRQFRCGECGLRIGRDHNAAMNLEQLPVGNGEVTPAEIGVPAKRKPSRSRSPKRERPKG